MNDKELISMAVSALKYSYSPYSDFKVGAALLSKNGRVFTGTNVESSAFSATTCAERTAFAKAIAEGEREFTSIAVVGGKNGVITEYCPPCGVCRQIMAEFCGKDFKIILFDGKNINTYTLDEILPLNFGRKNIC